MGLFDEISGLVGGALGGGAGANPEQHVMDALQSAGIPGVGGLVQQLQQSGLGSQVASWIGSGTNQPVSAGEIEQALGGPAITAIAGKFGVDPSRASALLSQFLPGLVDRATPNGQVPDAGDGSSGQDC